MGEITLCIKLDLSNCYGFHHGLVDDQFHTNCVQNSMFIRLSLLVFYTLLFLPICQLDIQLIKRCNEISHHDGGFLHWAQCSSTNFTSSVVRIFNQRHSCFKLLYLLGEWLIYSDYNYVVFLSIPIKTFCLQVYFILY